MRREDTAFFEVLLVFLTWLAVWDAIPLPRLIYPHSHRVVRLHAAEWKFDPRRIGIIGFSAGGHLTSTVGTHFDASAEKSSDPVERLSWA